jgi:hypothetical protein
LTDGRRCRSVGSGGRRGHVAPLDRFPIPADPLGALQKVGDVKFPTDKSRSAVLGLVARAPARTDLEEAQTVAESMNDAGYRAGTLAYLSDFIPSAERQRKVALLERATIQANVATAPSDHVFQFG